LKKRKFGRPSRRRENNIKMDVKAIRWGRGPDWIDVAEDTERWRALVKAVMHIRIP